MNRVKIWIHKKNKMLKTYPPHRNGNLNSVLLKHMHLICGFSLIPKPRHMEELNATIVTWPQWERRPHMVGSSLSGRRVGWKGGGCGIGEDGDEGPQYIFFTSNVLHDPILEESGDRRGVAGSEYRAGQLEVRSKRGMKWWTRESLLLKEF